MTRLRLFFILFSLALVSLMTACQPMGDTLYHRGSIIQQTPEESFVDVGATDQVRVALIMKSLGNPFFAEMEKGARRAESELGVRLIVRAAAQETAVEQQIEIVDALIKEQVDAIVIAPAEPVSLVPVLKKAHAAGIVIINVDDRLDEAALTQAGLEDIPFISVDNELGAYLSARSISAGITKTTQAAIIEGVRVTSNAQARKNGALRAFAENPHVQVVALETANWKIDQAYAVTSQLLKDYPDIQLIFCANDMMALGAIQLLQDANRSDIKVAAYDGLEEALRAVKDGRLAATIDQQAAEQGYLSIKYAVQGLNGERVPPITLLDVKLIQSKDLQ